MLTAVLIAIILLQFGINVWVAWVLSDVRQYQRETFREVMRIKRTRRTRQTRASMRNGVETQEHKLVELGRATQGKRVVVGGDPESELYQALSRRVAKGENDE